MVQTAAGGTRPQSAQSSEPVGSTDTWHAGLFYLPVVARGFVARSAPARAVRAPSDEAAARKSRAVAIWKDDAVSGWLVDG